MPEMQAILVQDGKSASASSLKHGSAPRPVPKAGEAVVKIKAFGLNRMDIIQRQVRTNVSLLRNQSLTRFVCRKLSAPPGVSSILGVEFSGTIEESASGTWKKGDECFGLAFGGAYAEYIAVNEGMIVSKPESLPWEEAAAIPENWLTAYQALFLIAEMQKGARVLIHAGASGVGVAANQLARAFGAKEVFTTAGSQEKLDFLTKLGATCAYNYKTQDWAKEILERTGGVGVDVVIDFIGANYWHSNISVLARDGRMVMLGLMSGFQPKEPLDLRPILFKRIRVEGTTLRSRTVEYQTDLLHQFRDNALPKLLGQCQSGIKFDLVIHKVYSWKDIIAATEEMEQAKNMGKIVCTVD